MATKKETPVEEMEQPEENLQQELEALRKENAALKAAGAGVNPYGKETDRERVAKACEEAAAKGKDPWSVTVSVKAPRKRSKDDPFYWMNVNGRTIQIPANDRYFDLALPFAQCLTDMIAAEWGAEDFADSIVDYDPVTNPHPGEGAAR